jgi:hypothetical protein
MAKEIDETLEFRVRERGSVGYGGFRDEDAAHPRLRRTECQR